MRILKYFDLNNDDIDNIKLFVELKMISFVSSKSKTSLHGTLMHLAYEGGFKETALSFTIQKTVRILWNSSYKLWNSYGPTESQAYKLRLDGNKIANKTNIESIKVSCKVVLQNLLENQKMCRIKNSKIRQIYSLKKLGTISPKNAK